MASIKNAVACAAAVAAVLVVIVFVALFVRRAAVVAEGFEATDPGVFDQLESTHVPEAGEIRQHRRWSRYWWYRMFTQ
jgi:hypothetical protein